MSGIRLLGQRETVIFDGVVVSCGSPADTRPNLVLACRDASASAERTTVALVVVGLVAAALVALAFGLSGLRARGYLRHGPTV